MTRARAWLLTTFAVGLLALACGGDTDARPEASTTATRTASASESATSPAGTTEGPFRILALGDSYTIGERVPRAESWPLQLREVLRGSGLDVAEPLVIAQTGWTTDDLIRATESTSVPLGPYDLVTLLIGVNNEFQGWLAEEFRPELVTLLARSLAFAGGERQRVIVLSIPDYGVTPAQIGFSAEVIAASIDRFNAVVAEEAARFGFAYVDVTDISRDAADDRSLIAPDGLHPAGTMYTRWVELLEPLVAARFASLGAVSAGWSEAQVEQYEHEVRLRRHP